MQERTRPGRAGHGSAKISVPLTAGGYRPQGAGGGWLWVIARRQAALWLRRRGRAAGLIAALTQAEDPAGGDPAEVASSRTDLAAAVEALGPPGGPERELWRLLYVEDRPGAEVAELMGIPAGTVKSRAYRVRRLLRAALGGQPVRQGGAR